MGKEENRQQRDCSTCDGTGTVVYEIGSSGYLNIGACRACKGTGKA